MLMQAKFLAVVLLAAVCNGQSELEAERRDCSDACPLAFRCNLYYQDTIWAIVKGVCQMFQNGCFFAQANCVRENKCLKPLEPVDQKDCQRRCITCDETDRISPVCATFASLVDGVNTEEYITFDNQCLAEQYACQNARAIFYTTPNACT